MDNIDSGKLSRLLNTLVGKSGNASQLARNMKVNAQTLRAYIRGDITNPTKEFLRDVARYMNIETDALVAQVARDYVHIKESSAVYYIDADDAIPRLEKMPPQEKLKVAKYLLNNAV